MSKETGISLSLAHLQMGETLSNTSEKKRLRYDFTLLLLLLLLLLLFYYNYFYDYDYDYDYDYYSVLLAYFARLYDWAKQKNVWFRLHAS